MEEQNRISTVIANVRAELGQTKGMARERHVRRAVSGYVGTLNFRR